MTRSAHIARPVARTIARLVLLALAIISTLLIAGGTAKAATDVGPYTLYTTADLCKLTVTPKDASALVGTQQTFTATITAIGPDVIQAGADDGINDVDYEETYLACAYKEIDELEDALIKFTVVSGPNAGKTENVKLDANGVANFTYTSAAAGTDVVEASIVLPDICFAVGNEQDVPKAAVQIPDACSGMFQPTQGPQENVLPSCQQWQVEAVNDDCLTVTLSDTGQVTWSAPQVTAEADPSMSITAFKRCVSRKFKISPSYSGGTITSSTLFVDGKKKQTKYGSEPFSLSPRSYKAGKHNFEVVTVFSSGKAASKFGSFTKCAARVTVKRVSPKFTG